jgi:hypothetical protein
MLRLAYIAGVYLQRLYEALFLAKYMTLINNLLSVLVMPDRYKNKSISTEYTKR